jgi:dinuclear metal center YbgI/SA1388 family protein
LEDSLKLKNQEDWDNSGLQIGNMNCDIKTVMLTLDIDINTVNYAKDNNVDLIIAHHPFLFNTLRSIDLNSYDGKIIKTLIGNNINVYSMHTSLDMADMGVNKALADVLNIKNYSVLHEINNDGSGYGGIGDIEETEILLYAKKVKEALNCSIIKMYAPNKNMKVSKSAFCGGSGSDFILDAVNKCAHVYITGDIKYHQAQTALKNNLCIIDAGHFNTEFPVLRLIKTIIEKQSDINVIIYETNTVEEIII